MNQKERRGLSVPRHRDEEACEQMKAIVKKIRTMLGLKQVEFAILLNATMQTVSLWETKGVAPQGKRQTPFGNFLQLLGLLKQSATCPEFLPFEKLKTYIQCTARGNLFRYYLKYADNMDAEFLAALRGQNLYTVFFALLFDKYLESQGIETPEKVILAEAKGQSIPVPGDLSYDNILDMVEEIENAVSQPSEKN